MCNNTSKLRMTYTYYSVFISVSKQLLTTFNLNKPMRLQFHTLSGYLYLKNSLSIVFYFLQIISKDTVSRILQYETQSISIYVSILKNVRSKLKKYNKLKKINITQLVQKLNSFKYLQLISLLPNLMIVNEHIWLNKRVSIYKHIVQYAKQCCRNKNISVLHGLIQQTFIT